MESTPKPDEVKQRQCCEQDRPEPFPAPCYYQGGSNKVHGDQMDQKGDSGFPEAAPFPEYVQCKKTQKQGKKDTQDPGSPE